MKMVNKEFALFQREFIKWRKLFRLTGYKIYFKYEPLEQSFANITILQSDMVVTVRLNSELPDRDKPPGDVKQSAKHEAVHLLLSRLENRALARFISADDLYESVEEIVRRLEGLVE